MRVGLICYCKLFPGKIQNIKEQFFIYFFNIGEFRSHRRISLRELLKILRENPTPSPSWTLVLNQTHPLYFEFDILNSWTFWNVPITPSIHLSSILLTDLTWHTKKHCCHSLTDLGVNQTGKKSNWICRIETTVNSICRIRITNLLKEAIDLPVKHQDFRRWRDILRSTGKTSIKQLWQDNLQINN